jgi:penicillin-insensitive murein endopeptidase
LLRASTLLVVSTALGAGSAHAAPFPSAWLPRHGDGYLIPDTWAERGLRYGTPALVGLVERAARTVAAAEPGATLYIADLSLKSGAWTQWHRSHRNGCDADLIFFAVDDRGRPAPVPAAMIPFDDDGVGFGESRSGERVRLHFDTARNWALVRALLGDGETPIARIFIADWLRARLLAYAADSGEDPALVARAADILAQPGDSQPHNDHMHVRIAPPPGLAVETAATFARTPRNDAHRPAKHTLARHDKARKTKAKQKSKKAKKA